MPPGRTCRTWLSLPLAREIYWIRISPRHELSVSKARHCMTSRRQMHHFHHMLLARNHVVLTVMAASSVVETGSSMVPGPPIFLANPPSHPHPSKPSNFVLPPSPRNSKKGYFYAPLILILFLQPCVNQHLSHEARL
jgi:hypothetical protein